MEKRRYKTESLLNKTFGHLTVIGAAPREHNRLMWLCECDCDAHTHIVVSGTNLRNGVKTHCKFCQKPLNTNRGILKKTNKYDLSGECGIGVDENGNEFYFDLEDYDKIRKYYWKVSSQNGYVTATTSRGEYTTRHILLHRFIMNPPNDMVVDHINRQKTDNRKTNLRICTQKENMQNVDRRGKEYYAPITAHYTIDGYPQLGEFTTRQEAIDVYQQLLNKEDEN